MRARALALTAAGTLLVSGCTVTVPGIASPTLERSEDVTRPDGSELADAAAEALLDAGSVHYRGGISIDGVQFQLDYRLRGADTVGSVTEYGDTSSYIVASGESYLRGSAVMWEARGASAADAERVAGTWVRLPPRVASGLDLPTLSGVAGRLAEWRGGEVTLSELDGRPVWQLTASDGFVFSVAAEGVPYPLRMASIDVDPGVLRYDEFGTVAPIMPPAHFVEFDDFDDLGE